MISMTKKSTNLDGINLNRNPSSDNEVANKKKRRF